MEIPRLDAERSGLMAKWLCFLFIAILLLISAWAWNRFIQDRFFPRRFGTVEQGLIYRSGRLYSGLVEETIKKYHIAKIIDLTGTGLDNRDKRAEVDASLALGVELVQLPLDGDGGGDIRRYAEAIWQIYDATVHEKPVLVHCAAGSQRTGGVIAAYRLLVQHRLPAEVYNEMMRYDWSPDKDQGLLSYLNQNMSVLAKLLVEKGVLSSIPKPLPQLRS